MITTPSFKRSHFILILFFSLILNSQDFQGKAYYMSKTTVDMSNFGRPNMSEDQRKRMEERLKKMFEKTFILTFNRTESVYKLEEKLEAPNQGGGGRFGAIMSGAVDGITYKNIKTKKSLSEYELFGKLFLVTEDMPDLNWSITNETKQIGGYTCMKATAIKISKDLDFVSLRRRSKNEDNSKGESENDEDTSKKEIVVTAWYTMQIPVNHGPSGYYGLPGLILELNTRNSTILCSKIVLNPEDKITIKQPTKGKEVTKDEYIDIATTKYQEMRENFRRGRDRR